MQKKKILALYFLALGILTEVIVMTALIIDHNIEGQQSSARTTLVSTLAIFAGQENGGPYESAMLAEGQATGQPGTPMVGDEYAYSTFDPALDGDHAPGSEPADSDPSYVYNPLDATSQAAGMGSYDDLSIPRGSEPYDSAYPGPDYSGNNWNDAYPGAQDADPTVENPTATITQAVAPTATQALPTTTQAVPTATFAAPTATQPQAAQPTQTATTARTSTPTQAAPAATATATTAPSPQPTPTIAIIPGENGSGELVSVRAAEVPVLDGASGDAAWTTAPELLLETQGGANASATRVSLRSVHDGESVYFLLTWADPTQSWLRLPWEMQTDGTWKQLSGPDTRGNDETVFYEDKLALFWPTGSEIQTFSGCGSACHTGENSDVKPYGNMYTPNQNALWDLWQWKSVRGAGQVDDQYLDGQPYSQDTPAAGFHPDPDSGGGYSDNRAGDLPAFMAANGGDRSGAPGYLPDSEKTVFDAGLFQPGERVPGVITAPFAGDRGDIQAGWRFASGVWTLEIRRRLVTGSAADVQFDDLRRAYPFGLATFDNAQVRHAYEDNAAVLKFAE